MKRFWVVLLALIFVLSLGLAGCGETPQTPVTPPSTEKGDGDGDGDGSDEDPPAPPEEEPMTFADLLETKKAAGKTFFTEHIRSAVTQAVVLAETVNFIAEEDDTELEQISYAYIYKAEGTARKYDVVNLTLPAPVSFDDIASGKAGDVTPSVQTVLSFGFDAQEYVDKTELCDALAYRIGKRMTIGTNASKYFGTVERTENGGDSTLKYPVLFEDGNKFFVASITIYDRNYEEAQLIENLYDQTKYDYMRCGAGFKEEFAPKELDGDTIFRTAYQAEFEKENPGPVTPGTEEKIESVEDLVTNYSAELNQGLQGAYDNISREILSKKLPGFNASKIVESKWNLDGENQTINKINFMGKYDRDDGNYTLFVASMDFGNDPIELNKLAESNENLTEKNIANKLKDAISSKTATYNYEIYFNYNENLQTQYQELAEAVFEKTGLKEEGATYYISSPSSWDGGQNGTLGNYKAPTLLQVTQKGIKRVTIKITEGDLVNNVKNGLYTIASSTSYALGEYTINAETNKVAKTSHSLYNEDTGYHIEDFGDDSLFEL